MPSPTTAIGAMRRHIRLQEDQGSRTAGSWVENWQDVALMWGQVMPLGGREYLAAEQLTTSITHEVTVRYRTDVTVTAKHRLIVEGRILDIRAVIDVENRHRHLQLMCEEHQI